jgi:cytoskeleton protein RodZ
MSDQEHTRESAGLTPGQWLQQERERQGRTVQQVATELRLGVNIVEAIESNRFAVLSASVFARGHLRNYANLLGVSPERALELYQALSDRPRDADPVPVIHRDSEPSIPMSPDSKERKSLSLPPMQWLVIGMVAAVLVAILLVGWLRRDVTPSVPETTSSQTVDPTVAQVELPAPTDAVVPSSGAIPTTESTPNNAPPAAQARNSTALSRGKMKLRFVFSGESWVEVYDARGNRMLYDVGSAGQSRSVDIEPPAQVVLGLASAVVTEVNGREVAVPPRRIANQVARYTVAADGSVQ